MANAKKWQHSGAQAKRLVTWFRLQKLRVCCVHSIWPSRVHKKLIDDNFDGYLLLLPDFRCTREPQRQFYFLCCVLLLPIVSTLNKQMNEYGVCVYVSNITLAHVFHWNNTFIFTISFFSIYFRYRLPLSIYMTMYELMPVTVQWPLSVAASKASALFSFRSRRKWEIKKMRQCCLLCRMPYITTCAFKIHSTESCGKHFFFRRFHVAFFPFGGGKWKKKIVKQNHIHYAGMRYTRYPSFNLKKKN